MPKNGEVDVNALLADAATAAPATKSKSKAPRVEIKGLEPKIKQWIKAKTDMDNAEAEMKSAAVEIIAAADEAKKAECRKVGKYETSIVINGQVQVVTQNKYSKIDPSKKAEIEKVVGEEEYCKLFTTKTEVELTDAALADGEILKKLIGAVGPDKFKTYFKVSQTLVPTSVLHEGIVMDKELDVKTQKLKDAGILKPYTPAVKPV
jgi:hypothetical protein